MTSFDDVFGLFLSKITTFEEYLNLSEEELNEEMKVLLRTSMAKFINKKDIILDYNSGTFNRQLSDLEIEITNSYK